ncbi:hypothetical protein BS47DRAFT_1341664 [Hydnum rufescens UP504]|uniref:Xylulose kinase n=1 Tax=Hydnum rufescens UP504 TaxID=1448309 RepID=A0A9P6DYI9_9AGAM|nr:hypothetical protein BS47DRAFT_1341664 [Hydnum rufescens UP504]
MDIDENIICERIVHFDRDIPHYGTQNGSIAGSDGEITCPVALWIESVDLLLSRFESASVNFGEVVAVSGAAQQHGSVYWTEYAPDLLASLDPSRTLGEQLMAKGFSLPNAPIWQDSSTTAECAALEQAVGGPQKLSDMTGSRAYERFTGSQISKIYHRSPATYTATRYISLVSSFVSSLFLCHISPIEVSDASGMNLMDIKTCRWDETLLSACGGPTLRSKLAGEPVHGGTVLGKIGQWWVKRYGFSSECIVAPFTGDNPATIVTLSSPGDAILSLGTSTTLLISVPPPSANSVPPICTTTSHLLAHPTTAGGSIVMLCIKNGGLTREVIRDKYSSGSWSVFNDQVLSRPPGNSGCLGFYFTLREIIPTGVVGDHCFVDSQRVIPGDTEDSAFPPSAHARAVLESQLLSIRSRLASILPPSSEDSSSRSLKRCVITGGSSVNPLIQQMVADILGLPTYVAPSGAGSAASGGALLAKFAWWKVQRHDDDDDDVLDTLDHAPGTDRTIADRLQETGSTFEDMRKESGGLVIVKVAEPDRDNERVYEGMIDTFRKCEDMIVRSL